MNTNYIIAQQANFQTNNSDKIFPFYRYDQIGSDLTRFLGVGGGGGIILKEMLTHLRQNHARLPKARETKQSVTIGIKQTRILTNI